MFATIVPAFATSPELAKVFAVVVFSELFVNFAPFSTLTSFWVILAPAITLPLIFVVPAVVEPKIFVPKAPSARLIVPALEMPFVIFKSDAPIFIVPAVIEPDSAFNLALALTTPPD